MSGQVDPSANFLESGLRSLELITDLRKSHTAADFIAFLNKIDREVTDDLDVHVILDNLSTHKTRPCASGYCATPGFTSTSPPPTGRG